MIKMNEEDFITKFYSCDNEEQFLKDICHNLNCLQKVQNNWNELKKWLEEKYKNLEYANEYCIERDGCDNDYDINKMEVYKELLDKMQELEQGKDE